MRRTLLTGWLLLIDRESNFLRLLAGFIVSIAALVGLLVIRPYKRASDFQLAVCSYILVVFQFLGAMIVNQWQATSSLCGEVTVKLILDISSLDQIIAALLVLTCALLPFFCAVVAYDAHVTRKQQQHTSTQHAELVAENVSLGHDILHLMETANAPIFGLDEDGCINEWNNKAEMVTGYLKREVIGWNFVNQLVKDEQRESVRCMLKRALTGEEESVNFELAVCSRDRDFVEILLNMTARQRKGHIVGVIGIGQDVTALKAEQAARGEAKELEAAARAQEELMAYLFHDMAHQAARTAYIRAL